jgi:phytol kinase
MLLCGGDGLADIVGRRIRSPKLPWSNRKTVAGSLAVFAAGSIFTLVVLWIYHLAGAFTGSLMDDLLPVLLISIAGTAVESFPFPDIDNLSVPAVAVLLGSLLFK